MLPFKKIIWPTDFSEPSFTALNAAAELANHFFAELYLVHVVPPLPVAAKAPGGRTTFNADEYEKQLTQAGKAALKEVAETKTSKDLKTHQVIVAGNPADEIARVAEEVGADVIVIATHGTTGWKRLVFGSVAGKVIQCAKCPVLTIRASAK